MRSKRSKATEFNQKARSEIVARDRGECIFCGMNYYIEECDYFNRQIKDLMHYIPRSAGGLGIPQNAAIGCRSHHTMLDNGNKGRRDEMMELFKGYLKSKYPDWDEKKLKYDRWAFLRGEKNGN